MLSDAIASGDTAAINYFIAEKYVKAIEALAASPNQKTFIMPMEMAGLAGTLAGISEVARAAFTQGGAPRQTGSVPSTPRQG